MNTDYFNEIRPYRNDEIPDAMNRIADNELLSQVASYIYPDKSLEDVRAFLRNIKTIYEFQHSIMWPAINWIVKNTIKSIIDSGMEFIDKNKSFLFVSNHRDIVLDAMILQMLLDSHNFNTCEITFGSNLMMNQFIVDIGKSNKMFKTERPSNNMREFAQKSQQLSEYIRHTIKNGTSVWIAQRNGRTKDGFDKTDQGLITMFSMSGNRNDLISNISELNITPIAISYEIEPCDILKTREMFVKRKNGEYVKKPMEDLNSILTGIKQYKGNIDIKICEPITREDLEPYKELNKRDIIKNIATIIDEKIYKAYKLFPNNYIAHDILNNKSQWSDFYNEKEKEEFNRILDNAMTQLCQEFGKEAESDLRNIFLGIYANPVANHLSVLL